MSVRKTDVFVADVERQSEWYVLNAGWDVAEGYLDAVEATCRLLGRHPQIGRAASSLTRVFATGAFSSYSVLSKSTSFSTKWPATMS